ncbi:MAG: alpha/beta fold hydrolase [Steroidobacteraceae bacterium]
MRAFDLRRIPGVTGRRPGAAPLCLIACCALAALASIRPAGAAVPLEAYGRLPHFEHISLSPDGTRVAVVRTEGEQRVLAITDLATGRLLAKVGAGDEKLRGIEWADDAHVVIETSVTGVLHGNMFRDNRVWEWFQVQVYDLTSGKLLLVPQSSGSEDLALLNVVGSLAVRRVKNRTMIFVTGWKLGKGGRGQYAERVLLSVSLDTHAVHVVSEAKPETAGWVIDADGGVAAEETYQQKNGHWSVLIPHDGRMREAASGIGLIEFPRLLGLGPTADTLLVSSIEEEEPVWRLLSLKDGTMSPPMAERKALERPIESRTTHRMIGGVHIADSIEFVFFDPAIEQTWLAIVRALPDEHVILESASSNFGKVIVRVEGERDGFGYQLVDLATHRAEALGDIYEGVSKPFEVRRITYAAADGLMIPAYLTLPRGKPAQKLPLIVLPHGGPAVRDTADFDWWSQALADQGYAVLRPNYRGSDITRAFLAKGFGEWGRKMQTDLSDGVRYLAKEGVIDPARVCIVGASYGGYAALAGVSLDPGVYRCAVSFAGLSDLHRLLSWVNLSQSSTGANRPQRYWDRFMGVSGADDPALDAISPIKHLGAVTVPVLLIHGKDDTVVPFEQSQVMYDALQRDKKNVQLIALNGEDHWLSRSATRLQMLQSSVAFLRANNPPEP